MYPQGKQGVAHKRGGIHRIKDEHRTNTKWDTFRRAEMEAELKTRPGLYEKDLKKHEIAKLLADDDHRQALEKKKQEQKTKKDAFEAKKKRELQEKQKEEARRQYAKRKEEERQRREEKERREREERKEKETEKGESVSVSDDSELNSEEYVYGGEGEVLDESSWDETTASETSTTLSTSSPLFPHSKLRIFEWPDSELPSLEPPQSPQSPDSLQSLQSKTSDEELRDDLIRALNSNLQREGDGEQSKNEGHAGPWRVPYAVMHLVTTSSGEILELPGRTYPELIGADFVPKLTQHVMDCARNGVLVGTLRKAVIESGKDWAERTTTQWWSGRMLLHLPPRTSAVPLQQVYTKWAQKKASSKISKTGDTNTARQRKLQSIRDRKSKLLDIYANSEYRPPIVFAPVHLDYPQRHEDDKDGPRELKTLFYVRFSGMDLPHYYFWARPNEWDDPTTPNPKWSVAKAWDEDQLRADQQEHEESKHRLSARPNYHQSSPLPYPLDTTKIRVRKPGKFNDTAKRLPKDSKFHSALWRIERQLYQDGLATVLHKYRERWRENEREEHWQILTKNLPRLYPSGQMPECPPVHLDEAPRSLAEKIASIEAPAPSRPIEPIRGDEPWTLHDDEYWDIVDAPSRRVSESDIQQGTLRSIYTPSDKDDLDVLFRRGSANVDSRQTARSRKLSSQLDAWLKILSPSFLPPLDTNMSVSPVGQAIHDAERRIWEDAFNNAVEQAKFSGRKGSRRTSSATNVPAVPNLISTIDSMPVEELKWQLYLLMKEGLNRDQCSVCLEPLEVGDSEAVNRHYQNHHGEADARCPFCGMDWPMLDSEWKAAHILNHDFNDYTQHRRASTPTLYSDRRSASGTRDGRRFSQVRLKPAPRRASKVHFSPKTVERRVPYNDVDDPGVEADFSEIVSPILKRSNLKKKLPKRTKPKSDRSNRITKDEIKPKAGTATRRETRGTNTRRPTQTQIENAAWDPRRYSSSSHVTSPYLPSFKRYPRDHPNATFNPRKWSSSDWESLEFNTGHRGDDEKSKAGTGKGRAKGKRRNKADEREYVDMPSSASSGPLPPLIPESRRRGKVADQRYHPVPSPSSASSYAAPEPSRKRKGKTSDPPYRGTTPGGASSSDSNVLFSQRSLIAPKKTTKRSRARANIAESLKFLDDSFLNPSSRNTSTVSNASSNSAKCRANSLLGSSLDIVPPPDNSSSTVGGVSTPSRKRANTSSPGSRTPKKRKISTDRSTALYRRGSGIPVREDDGHDKDDVGDVWNEVTDSSYAQTSSTRESKAQLKAKDTAKVTKTTQATKATKAKATEATSLKTKVSNKTLSSTEEAKTLKHKAQPQDLAIRRSERKAATKTTLSNRLFVEPLVLAPAIPWGNIITRPEEKANTRPNSASPLATQLTDDIEDWRFELPTPTPTSSGFNSNSTTKKFATISARGRRSSAPTPSPSITYTTTTISPIYVKRPSYDFPYSDARPMVPPNTPANRHPPPSRRTSLGTVAAIESDTNLDAVVLSDKIGNVKTTRASLVREGPATKSLGFKQRGPSQKETGSNKTVISGRVEKKTTKGTKAVSKTKVAVKPKAEPKPKAIPKSKAGPKVVLTKTALKPKASTKVAPKTEIAKTIARTVSANSPMVLIPAVPATTRTSRRVTTATPSTPKAQNKSFE